ncbi:AraC-like DNA-binding protein/mannose-6-phosphate isomerase-like protein (cupin superfamily) [Bacillus niacini]|uniref:AraC-like DNA-binding protein/mannose-6-phosphate isomerase-like protein (Cupin superfamily) n=1 Tax=Neobacillus niacini TaxID=86668 RepID=A0A852TAQ4_9BACI|nr:AraC family transcriptional regulator [Neobacillus niacini]NYE05860.1 AraC-like DNA-binding protein/mannose-6-phosphate isomerase-like protein (cupin superfamily) [Neobacillus niacini]
MELTQNQLQKGITLLNQHAVYIKGTEGSLYLHYWGGDKTLKSNMLHKHSFFEVCYIVSGTGIYLENGKEYPLSKGTLFISRPHIKHQIISQNDLYILFVAFEPIYAESTDKGQELFQLLSTVEPFLIKDEEDLFIEMMWKMLILQAQQSTNFIHDTIISTSGSLIFSLAEHFIKENHNDKDIKNQPLSTTHIHRAKLYIRDNLSQPLRLKDVADNLRISSRHLSRLFTEELGVTFTQYVRNERINLATILLTTTDLSIKSIASETGFDTVHYFTTVFKEIIGVTPGEFNKQLQTN